MTHLLPASVEIYIHHLVQISTNINNLFLKFNDNTLLYLSDIDLFLYIGGYFFNIRTTNSTDKYRVRSI